MTDNRRSPAGGLDPEQIAARLQAATPGRWKHIKDDPMFMGEADIVQGPAIEVRGRVYRKYPSQFAPDVEADAVFIAHAPEDIAALLEEVRALRTALRPFTRSDVVKYGASSRGVWKQYEVYVAEAYLLVGAPERDQNT